MEMFFFFFYVNIGLKGFGQSTLKCASVHIIHRIMFCFKVQTTVRDTPNVDNNWD